MADLGDLKLDKWRGSSFEPDHSRPWWRIPLILLVLAALGVSGYFLLYRRVWSPSTPARVHTEQSVDPAPAKPVPAAGEAIDLPPLPETDPIVRQLVGNLSSHPTIAAWLATDQLVRNFTVVVFNIAGGRTPAKQLSRVRPVGRFQVAVSGTNVAIDPRSYRRYDAYADAVAGLDAQGTARLYATLKPRIQDAYRELGYPDGNFDQALERAIVELLKTPVIEGTIALRPKSVAYEFSDPALQSLSSAQRQFLRMGPRNVRLIQAKLREIAPLLGIAPQSLPQ
jgi:Protein of unknown function (DUF3014)